MRLLNHDSYESLTRVLDQGRAIVALDVGANEGVTSRRILDLWPSAQVWAFEPSPSVLATLRAVANEQASMRVVQAAVGAREGLVEFHVTEDHWCSSVLAPSELGKRYYGAWLDVAQRVQVPLITLDDWSRREGVSHVDLIKVDTQGYDLEVLKGAAGLLQSSVTAVNCEFQFASEYEGCSTFSQIDRFLGDLGFSMYQLHEVWSKGNEEQTSCGDGLWLKSSALSALRARRDLPDLTPAGRIGRALREHSQYSSVAIYGAGRHTRQALPGLGEHASRVGAVIDDNPALRGSVIEGKPVISSGEALRAGVNAVILSSDTHEPALWKASSVLRAAGVKVVSLYGRYE